MFIASCKLIQLQGENMSTFISPLLWKRLGLLAACTLGCAVSAHAGVAASVTVNDGSAAGQVSDYGTVLGHTTYASANVPNAHATASARYGALMAGTHGGTSAFSSNTGAQASYSDTLWLDNAALYGQTGRVTLAYYFDYDAAAGATGSGFSNGSLSFLAWANSSYSEFLDYQRSDQPGYTMVEYRDPFGQGRTYGVPATNYLYVTTDFTWGQGINTSFQIQASIGAYVPSNVSGTATYDFTAHGGYWAGIVSASANGKQVTDYALTSLSGTDYSQSFVPANDVPEPATAAIFLAGLALLGVQRARKG
jgi:hypothetical protein